MLFRSVYEAIDDGRFEDFMFEKYISPHLQKQTESIAKERNNILASTIANSFKIDEDLLAKKIGAELEWRNRNGIKVKGIENIIEAISKQPDPRKQ